MYLYRIKDHVKKEKKNVFTPSMQDKTSKVKWKEHRYDLNIKGIENNTATKNT